MASISAPRLPSTSLKHTDSNPTRYTSPFPRFIAASSRCPLSNLRRSELGLCRCRNAHSGSPPPGDDGGWKSLDSLLHYVARSAVKRLEDCVNSFRKLSDVSGLQLGNASVVKKSKEAVVEEVEGKGWDWKRWKRHFAEIKEQEWIVSVIKMQLNDAIAREDYEAAAKLKIALHVAKKNDTVGSAIYEYNKAIAEERYNDAAFLQHNAGTGLLGWWAGISKDGADTYGRIAHISAEHGRYVARSYSSRQLAMSKPGSPLFEIYFTCDNEGYKRQAVYLKRNTGHTANISKKSTNKSARSLNESNGSTEGPTDISSEDVKTIEEIDDDSDWIDGLAGIRNILHGVIPGVKVKVLKVVAPGKVDGDLISKVIEQIIEEDEDSDEEIHESEEEYIKSESDIEEIEMVGADKTDDTTEEQSEVSVKFVIGTLLENVDVDVPNEDLVRVPAELEIRDHLSFSFSVKKEDLQHETDAGQALQNKIFSRSLQRSSNHVRSDLSKAFVAKEKMPIKVLVDIGELISLSVNHNQNQLLAGTTHFNRIEIPTTSDPLSGLYIGAHGMYTSELLLLKRRFGQWHDDDGSKKPNDLEFYEYVEAYKLTGALSIPAGQVVFRAKVGKKNQLPHKGIIPEEFGVIARFMAQGRLADPGFQNPRWVDGELVILDGKNIRGGPVIGFVYWAPENHFLVFFNRLRLPD